MKHSLVVMWILRFEKYNEEFALNTISLSYYNFGKEHFIVHNCNTVIFTNPGHVRNRLLFEQQNVRPSLV